MWNPFKRQCSHDVCDHHVCDSVILNKYIKVNEENKRKGVIIYDLKKELEGYKLVIDSTFKHPNPDIVRRIIAVELENRTLRERAQGQEDQWLREEVEARVKQN